MARKKPGKKEAVNLHVQKFYEFVTDRPCQELPETPASCPWCNGANLLFYMHVSYLTESIDNDVSVASYFCKPCRRYFLRQCYKNNVYYTTSESRLIRGVCRDIDIELFCQFNCATCGGQVVKKWFTQQGMETHYRCSGNKITFVCLGTCGKSLDTVLESPLDIPSLVPVFSSLLPEPAKEIQEEADEVYQIINGLD